MALPTQRELQLETLLREREIQITDLNVRRGLVFKDAFTDTDSNCYT